MFGIDVPETSEETQCPGQPYGKDANAYPFDTLPQARCIFTDGPHAVPKFPSKRRGSLPAQ